MSTCTFFGHRESYGLSVTMLENAIKNLISQGVSTFYVGNQGSFDTAVYGCLKKLQKTFPIKVYVILAYIPTEKHAFIDMSDTIYPPIEGHPKFAIDRCNRWMIKNSDFCICYVNHSFGGAYKFAMLAKKHDITTINLGSLTMI